MQSLVPVGGGGHYCISNGSEDRSVIRWVRRRHNPVGQRVHKRYVMLRRGNQDKISLGRRGDKREMLGGKETQIWLVGRGAYEVW